MSNLIMMIIFNFRGLIMTRKEAKELLPIMQAFAEGKTIQLFTNGIWEGAKNPTFESGSMYRIKPEPKFRPFKNQEECWNEMLEHQPFGWIQDDYKYIHISSVFKDEIECSPDEDDDGNLHACIIKFTSVYEQGYTFADGTPFGVKEE